VLIAKTVRFIQWSQAIKSIAEPECWVTFVTQLTKSAHMNQVQKKETHQRLGILGPQKDRTGL